MCSRRAFEWDNPPVFQQLAYCVAKRLQQRSDKPFVTDSPAPALVSPGREPGRNNPEVIQRPEFQLGISPDHLRYLQTDESSRRLGFDKDATIRLAQQCTEEGAGEHTTLGLPSSWDPYLKEIAPEENQGLFTILIKESHVYVQENHRHNAQVLANGSGTGVSP